MYEVGCDAAITIDDFKFVIPNRVRNPGNVVSEIYGFSFGFVILSIAKDP